MNSASTTERSIEELECEKYDHIPEPYDIAFWHCKVCKKELVFVTLETLKAERQKREEMVEAERERMKHALLLAYDLQLLEGSSDSVADHNSAVSTLQALTKTNNK